MSFKEVNALRKAGQLKEATTMAREDIAKCRDEWSCRALYWCLHETAKNADLGDLASIANEMQELLESMGDDTVAIECMQRIQKRLIPHAEVVRYASEEAKNNPVDAYNKVVEIFNSGELHSSHHNDFAWIIWRTLHVDKSEDVGYRKGLIEVYKQLNVERPSTIHSLILNEAVRVEKAWPQLFMFTEFIAWWGLENLTDDDWEQFVTDDNKRLMSRVEKMIYLYTKEVQSIVELIPSEAFMQVLDKAILKWNNDDNLVRCKALLLSRFGDKENAITMYRRAIALTSGQKFYLWNELANIVDDSDLQISLISKALSLRVPEEYLGKIRAHLAQMLFARGQYSEALYEIEKLKSVYAANGWNIPSSILDLAHMIPSQTIASNNTAKYNTWALKADEFMYAELPSIYMVKVAHREEIQERDGRQCNVVKWTLIDSTGNVVGIKPRKFNLNKARIGDCFEVKKSNDRIILVSPTDAQNVAWLKSFSGSISIKTNRDGKQFAFVDNCYVPEKMIKNISNGTTVECIAICQDNKWRCISIRLI